MSDEYHPRTPGRLIEILEAQSEQPRSWQREAATAIRSLTEERDALIEAVNYNIDLKNAAQSRNAALTARVGELEADRARLFDALMWIDGWEPETTAAVEKRFGLDVWKRTVSPVEQSSITKQEA